MNREAYKLYLLTEHWHRLRSEAIERDGNRCVRCEWPVRLQVHHKVYRKTPQDTLLADLETLCEKCHAREHGKAPPVRPSKNKPSQALTAQMAQESAANARREEAYAKPYTPKFRSIDTNRQNFAAPMPDLPDRSEVSPFVKKYIRLRTSKETYLEIIAGK